MPAPASIHALNAELKAWLFDHALPLWWETGVDRARSGFVERIGLDGKPVDGARRARVAARQTWAFATAGRLGWSGPWREAVAFGARTLTGVYGRRDGLFAILADVEGRLIDETPAPYEQAFALLALSAAHAVLGGDFEARAIRARQALLDRVVRPDGGILEAGDLQANPMMHLFEAAQAWRQVSDDPAWRDLADVIARSVLTRMIDRETGVIREQYGTRWRPRSGADVEPGHQFEWGWLLLRHGADEAAARRLIEIGESRGVERGVTIFSLDQTLAPRDRSARLWAQTERVHAHAAAGRWDDIPAAVAGLRVFLDVPIAGTWRDRLLPDGTFVEEAAPASSLYHLVSMVAALDEACRTAA